MRFIIPIYLIMVHMIHKNSVRIHGFANYDSDCARLLLIISPKVSHMMPSTKSHFIILIVPVGLVFVRMVEDLSVWLLCISNCNPFSVFDFIWECKESQEGLPTTNIHFVIWIVPVIWMILSRLWMINDTSIRFICIADSESLKSWHWVGAVQQSGHVLLQEFELILG